MTCTNEFEATYFLSNGGMEMKNVAKTILVFWILAFDYFIHNFTSTQYSTDLRYV